MCCTTSHLFIIHTIIIIVMLKHDQSDQRCGSEAGFVAMGVEARIRKASLWNEQDIVHHIYTGLEIYRNSITAGNVSNNGTDLLMLAGQKAG